MNIKSTVLAKAIGDTQQVSELLANSRSKIETTDNDPQAMASAFANLQAVSPLLQHGLIHNSRLRVQVDVPATPEATEAVGELMRKISETSMQTALSAQAASSPGNSISISPTVGGMGLGLVGGLGLGIVIESLRASASASGNPIASGLALGFGLIGTAAGGLLGNGGAMEFEGFGVKIKASGKAET